MGLFEKKISEINKKDLLSDFTPDKAIKLIKRFQKKGITITNNEDLEKLEIILHKLSEEYNIETTKEQITISKNKEIITIKINTLETIIKEKIKEIEKKAENSKNLCLTNLEKIKQTVEKGLIIDSNKQNSTIINYIGYINLVNEIKNYIKYLSNDKDILEINQTIEKNDKTIKEKIKEIKDKISEQTNYEKEITLIKNNVKEITINKETGLLYESLNKRTGIFASSGKIYKIDDLDMNMNKIYNSEQVNCKELNTTIDEAIKNNLLMKKNIIGYNEPRDLNEFKKLIGM